MKTNPEIKIQKLLSKDIKPLPVKIYSLPTRTLRFSKCPSPSSPVKIVSLPTYYPHIVELVKTESSNLFKHSK